MSPSTTSVPLASPASRRPSERATADLPSEGNGDISAARAGAGFRGRWSNRLTGFLLLFLSSGLSGLCFSYIASQRWTRMPASTAVFAIAYTQWITLGVTVAKFGFDTYLFAALTRSDRTTFELGRFLGRYALPAAAVFALGLGRLFSPLEGILGGATVIMEAASVLVAAEQSARQRYTLSSISSLLKYPLFFLLLALVANFAVLDTLVVAVVLCAAALVRFVFAAIARERRIPSRRSPRPSLWCAVNQPLNFLMFRADQLLLPAVAAGGLGAANDYAYLTKWPELIAGAVSAAGLVWFPVWWKAIRAARRGDQRPCLQFCAGMVIYAAVVLVATAMYSRGARNELPLALIAPFAVHAVLVLPVNFGIYLLLRTDRLPGLVSKLLQSLGIGLPFAMLALSQKNSSLLAWGIPCQLLFFALLVAARPWGRRYVAYDRIATN